MKSLMICSVVVVFATLSFGYVIKPKFAPNGPIKRITVDICFEGEAKFIADTANLCWYWECVETAENNVTVTRLLPRRCALGSKMDLLYTFAYSNPCTQNFDSKIDFECTRGEQEGKEPACLKNTACYNNGTATFENSLCWCVCTPEWKGNHDCSKRTQEIVERNETTPANKTTNCLDNYNEQPCDLAHGCENNGVCHNTCSDFWCECPVPFTNGKRCEGFSCDANPCRNGGTCNRVGGISEVSRCICPPGLYGYLCEFGNAVSTTQPAATQPIVTDSPFTNPPITDLPVTQSQFTNPPVTQSQFTTPSVTQLQFTTPSVTQSQFTTPSVTQSQFTNPPVNQSRFTHPPVTQSRFTYPPVTQSRFTNPPVTQSRFTNPPVTQSRFTNPSVTQSRFTNPPVTQSRFTHPPVTQSRFTNPPVTQSRFTNPSVTRSRFTNPSVTRSRFTNLPVTQSRSTNLPVTQSRFTNLPVTQSGSTNLPVTQSRFTNLPVTQSGSTNLPVTQSRFTNLPVTQSRSTKLPVTQSRFTTFPAI